jgi:hypothetical protein
MLVSKEKQFEKRLAPLTKQFQHDLHVLNGGAALETSGNDRGSKIRNEIKTLVHSKSEKITVGRRCKTVAIKRRGMATTLPLALFYHGVLVVYYLFMFSNQVCKTPSLWNLGLHSTWLKKSQPAFRFRPRSTPK